jgi:hypothetical protein
MRACSEPVSSRATAATVSIPSSRHVRKTRTAISPRFATSSRRIGTRALYAGENGLLYARPVIRLLVRTVIVLLGNAVGLIVASLVFDDFEIDVTGFVVSVIVFTLAVALLGPFLENMLRRNRSSAAALGGVALLSTFVALLVTDLVSDGVSISGIGTWIGATVVVWLASLLAVFILPFLGLRRYLEERREP